MANVVVKKNSSGIPHLMTSVIILIVEHLPVHTVFTELLVLSRRCTTIYRTAVCSISSLLLLQGIMVMLQCLLFDRLQ